jgi:sugar (pentulose or hexulose) kinase
VGIPVVSTANDKAVEGLGTGLVNDGTVLVSLGTYITSMMVGEDNRQDTKSYWTNPGAIKGEFLYESRGIRRRMSTVTWIKDLLGTDILKEASLRGLSSEAYLEELAKDVSVGSNGLYTRLHWLADSTRTYERGVMIGFDGTHKGSHMFRSVLEGIAMTMILNRDIFNPIGENVALYAKMNELVYKYLDAHTAQLLQKSHEIFNS